MSTKYSQPELVNATTYRGISAKTIYYNKTSGHLEIKRRYFTNPH